MKKSDLKIEFKTRHDGVTCDGCDTYPIIGKRFRCLECYNYDLCEKCEGSKIH